MQQQNCSGNGNSEGMVILNYSSNGNCNMGRETGLQACTFTTLVRIEAVKSPLRWAGRVDQSWRATTSVGHNTMDSS